MRSQLVEFSGEESTMEGAEQVALEAFDNWREEVKPAHIWVVRVHRAKGPIFEAPVCYCTIEVMFTAE